MPRKEAKKYKALYFEIKDLEIFDLVYEMSDAFSWPQSCLTHFKVTNIGTNHDLMNLFSNNL